MIRRGASAMLILFVRAYQVTLRPWLVGGCRHWPTCSEYFIEAVSKHGPWRGGWMGLRRICRCHPWSKGGIDPVP